MSWELNIWPPERAGSPTPYTNGGPTVIEGGFRWQVRPTGGTEQLEFNALPRSLPIAARGLAQLKVNGTPVAYGLVANPAHPLNPDTVNTLTLPARSILAGRLMDTTAYYGQGVYSIVRDVLTRLGSPSALYVGTRIGNGTGTDAGPTLDVFYMPYAALDVVLDTLAKAAGTTWDIAADGVVDFGRPAPAPLVIPYADVQDWQYLRVIGEDTVGQVQLIIASAPSLPDGMTLTTPDYLPRPVTISSGGDSTYLVSRAVPVPDGLSVLTDVPGAIRTAPGIVNPDRAVDGDPATAATLPIGSGGTLVVHYLGLAVGARVTYSVPDWENRNDWDVVLRVGWGELVYARQNLGPTNGTVTATIILPPDVAGDISEFFVAFSLSTYATPPAGINAAVHDISIIRVDTAKAENLAFDFKQLPEPNPVEVTVPYLVTPSPMVQVTGVPGIGTLTGSAALYQFEHTPDNTTTTKIRLGSTGQSDAVRALKRAVSR